MNTKFLAKLALVCTFFSCLYTTASQNNYDPVTQDLPEINLNFPPTIHEVFIPVASNKMTGFILNANGEGPHPTFVLMHGLPGNEKNLDLAQSMRRAGFNILFFHYRGAWGSEGNYTFKDLHKDAQAALAFLRKNAKQYRVDTSRLSIMGHSFGGYAALRTGAEEKHLSCVVAMSAANPAAIARSKRVDESFDANIGKYVDKLFMLNNFSGKQAMAELKAHESEMDTTRFGPRLKGKRVFMIIGEQDVVIPPDLQDSNYENYTKVDGLKVVSKKIMGDHSFSVSRIKLQREVVNWSLANCQ